MVRDSKCWIKQEEGLYCLYSENKGADQLRVFVFAYVKAGFLIARLISIITPSFFKISNLRNFFFAMLPDGVSNFQTQIISNTFVHS